MRIAVPTFGVRVSPRFDCAQTVLLVSVVDGGLSDRKELAASDWAPHERINKLLELGVDTVLCGGIDCWSAESLRSAGVTIYGWVTGEVEDALACLLRGELVAYAGLGGGRFGGCQQLRGRGSGRQWLEQPPGIGPGMPGPPGGGQRRPGPGRRRGRRGP